MDIGVDGQEMCRLRSDGVIISTPIGSSGYSVSAGGPLLYASLNCMVFTPICPFLNTIPPMVFPHKTRFCIDLLPGTTETYITVDGQEGLLLQVGDRVEVTGLEDAVCFVGKEMPFFERLRTRGFVTDMASGVSLSEARMNGNAPRRMADVRLGKDACFDAWLYNVHRQPCP